jgi:hypothetical protein
LNQYTWTIATPSVLPPPARMQTGGEGRPVSWQGTLLSRIPGMNQESPYPKVASSALTHPEQIMLGRLLRALLIGVHYRCYEGARLPAQGYILRVGKSSAIGAAGCPTPSDRPTRILV